MLHHLLRLPGQIGQDLQGLPSPGGVFVSPEPAEAVEGLESLLEGPIMGRNSALFQGAGHGGDLLGRSLLVEEVHTRKGMETFWSPDGQGGKWFEAADPGLCSSFLRLVA
jgi:hypothetical protein